MNVSNITLNPKEIKSYSNELLSSFPKSDTNVILKYIDKLKPSDSISPEEVIKKFDIDCSYIVIYDPNDTCDEFFTEFSEYKVVRITDHYSFGKKKDLCVQYINKYVPALLNYADAILCINCENSKHIITLMRLIESNYNVFVNFNININDIISKYNYIEGKDTKTLLFNVVKILESNEDTTLHVKKNYDGLANSIINRKKESINNNIKVSLQKDIDKDNRIPFDFINMISQFVPSKNEARNEEYIICLKKNLANKYIGKIILVMTGQYELPKSIVDNIKLNIIETDHIFTFEEIVDFVNENIKVGVICYCNSDIFLDYKTTVWDEVYAFLNEDKYVLSLSRIEINTSGEMWHDKLLNQTLYASCQDTWLFKCPFEVADINFEPGTLGSDIAFNDRVKKSGYIPINRGTYFKTYHLDNVRKKNLNNIGNTGNIEYVKGEELLNERTASTNPERNGQYLLPEFDRVRNTTFDALINQFNLSDIELYKLKCDILSQFLKIKY